VVAYAALMTDRYPPFRMDMGPHEPEQEPTPGATHEATHEATPEPGPQPTPQPVTHASGWTAGRVVGVTVGSVVAVLAVLIGIAASALLAVDQGLRDRDGFLMSGTEVAESTGYAVTSEDLDIHVHSGTGELPRRLIGTVKITVDAGPGGQAVFVGIARTRDVERYLDGVAHSVITDLEGRMRHRHFGYREVGGGAPEVIPSEASIWEEQVVGTGRQELRWEPRGGEWTVVVMNADGTQGVEVEMTAGATVPVLGEGVAVIYLLGVLLLLLGTAIIAWAVALAHRSRVGAP
jgi:hypothetical protein